jgi:hypothetical protein
VTVEGKLLASNVVSYLDPTPVIAKMQELTELEEIKKAIGWTS